MDQINVFHITYNIYCYTTHCCADYNTKQRCMMATSAPIAMCAGSYEDEIFQLQISR